MADNWFVLIQASVFALLHNYKNEIELHKYGNNFIGNIDDYYA